MEYTNSKQFVKSKTSDESFLVTISSELAKDEDEPLSIKSLSITFLGILIAFLTFFLPTISILLGRSFSQVNETMNKQLIQKDGP